MGAVVVLEFLVMLHGPGDREILVNPATVTSMHAAITGRPNEQLSQQVRCLINTSDGKFISVIETCDQVRNLFRQGDGK